MNTELKNKIESIIDKYPSKRSALLPALWMIHETEGWISPQSMNSLAKLFGITEAEIKEVASFYKMFSLTPRGKNHIVVCTGLCCRLREGDKILEHIRKKLGINAGETTPDNKFTLSESECIGSCGTAPAIQINNEFYEDLTPEKIDLILASCA